MNYHNEWVTAHCNMALHYSEGMYDFPLNEPFHSGKDALEVIMILGQGIRLEGRSC